MGFLLALAIIALGGRKGLRNRGYRMKGHYYPPRGKRTTRRRYSQPRRHRKFW